MAAVPLSRVLAVLVLTAVAVAGCGSPQAASDDARIDDAPEVEATSTTGGIRGVVVDEAIRPLAGATVEAVCGEKRASNTTGENGIFTIAGLPAGACALRASHPLYDTVDLAASVEAGATDPPMVKVQLRRIIFAEPYSQTQKFDGFLVCSVGFSYYASEECGEGVGVPCEVPVLGCSRLGGFDQNLAQWDFWLDGSFARTLIVEMQWDANNPTMSEFQLNVANEWVCDPFCNGNQLNVTGGPSPLYATVDFPRELTLKDGTPTELSADTRFSTFVWPNWGSGDPQQLNVAVNQAYDVFATTFYYVPAPDGFSFIAGDEAPF